MANPTPAFFDDTKRQKYVKGVTSALDLADEAGVTADGNTASEQPARDEIAFVLDVTANDGDLTVTVETSPDDATWTTVDSFAAFNGGATGTNRGAFYDLDQYVRVTWTAANMTNGADFTVKAI